MKKINHVKKLTDSRFLNLYEVDGQNRIGKPVHYFVSSRARDIDQLKITTRDQKPDGVIIYSIHGEKKDKVVLIRQYRYSIDDYIYEFPAGLVDQGEDAKTAGIRELKEETGLDLTPIAADAMYEKGYFTTIGMTDESCATVYGYASGTISGDGLEDNEDIEVILADKEEVRRILKEECVAIMCAYMLMHFLKSEGDPLDFLQ